MLTVTGVTEKCSEDMFYGKSVRCKYTFCFYFLYI